MFFLRLLSAVFVITVFSRLSINAQNNGMGPYSNKMKWKQIENDYVRVIYPKGLLLNATRIANIISYEAKHTKGTVGEKYRKISIILGTDQATSNGYVALAPYHSAFQGIGMQDMQLLGSLDWLDVLSLHEYRHALQYANTDVGVTRIAHILSGESSWGTLTALALPNWYFEGDAVLTETLLSEAGRGRTPSFTADLRANLLSGKRYSYMTARNGSYTKHLVNHYPMGYIICNHIRNKYGHDVLKKVLHDASSFKGVFYPFSSALKRYTGKGSADLYQEAYDDFAKQTKEHVQQLKLTPLQEITANCSKEVIRYTSPHFLNDGSVIAIKTTDSEIPYIVKIGKKGREEKCINYGFSPQVYCSVVGNQLSWVELDQHVNRSNKSYTVICSYDLKNKKKKTLRLKKNYYSPSFSHDGRYIVVSETNEQLQHALVVLDAETGRIIKKFQNSFNDKIVMPSFCDKDERIIYIAKRDSKLALMSISMKSNQSILLLPWTKHTIGAPRSKGKWVYFSSSFTGIDNIYRIDITGKQQLQQISSVPVGVYRPAVSLDGKELIMSQVTACGSQLVKLEIQKNVRNFSTKKRIEPVDMSMFNVKTDECQSNILNKFSRDTYKEKSYKGFLKGMRIYSWMLAKTDSAFEASVEMKNLLNDTYLKIGAIHNENEKNWGVKGDFIYGKWDLKLGVHAHFQKRSVDIYQQHKKQEGVFFDQSYALTLSYPLHWLRGSYSNFIELKTTLGYRKYSDYKKMFSGQKNTVFGEYGAELGISHLRTQARKHIYPKWGYQLNASFLRDFNLKYTNQWKANAIFFFPGLFRNHGLKIEGAWRSRNAQLQFNYLDDFVYARGYEAPKNDEVYRCSADYVFPIAYPDFGMAGIFYLKRIRGAFFYDMMQTTFQRQKRNVSAWGAELMVDITTMNLLPISIGCREVFLCNKDFFAPEQKQKFELFFTLGI